MTDQGWPGPEISVVETVEETLEITIDASRNQVVVDILDGPDESIVVDLVALPGVPGPPGAPSTDAGNMAVVGTDGGIYVGTPTAGQVGADPAGTAASAVAAHEAEPDPHPQYETAPEVDAKLAANAAASDAKDAVLDARITAHLAAADPHPQYETASEVAAKIASETVATDQKLAANAAASDAKDAATNARISTHEGAVDPHPQYLTPVEGDARYAQLGNVIADHGALTGLADPDHPISAVQGLQAALDAKVPTSSLVGYQTRSEKGAAGGYAPLDAAGLVPTSHIPPLAVNETYTVADQAQMLALTAQRGDMAIRSDNGRTYVLAVEPASVLANWREVLAAGQVQSVNGQTGVVSLSAANVGADAAGTAAAALAAHEAANDVHQIADVSGLQTALNGKAPTSHTHAIGDLPSTLATDAEVATAVSTHAAATDAHPISGVTGLQTALNGKAPTAHSHVLGDLPSTLATDAEVATAVSTHAAANDAHPISGVTGLQTALNGKAPTSHTHPEYLEPTEVLAGENVTVVRDAGAGTVTISTSASAPPEVWIGPDAPTGTEVVWFDTDANPSTGGGGGLDQTAADARYVNTAGDTMTGELTLSGDATSALQAVPKQQVDAAIATHEAAADPHTAYQKESEKGAANGYASLDASGVVPTAQMPPLAVNETFTVADQAAMLALSAQRGDMAIRSDNGRTYVLAVEPASTLANWKEVLAAGQVQSVNGQTGVVSLTAANVGADPTGTAASAVSAHNSGSPHVALSSATPAALGTAAAGVGTTSARADHVHAMPTAAQVGALDQTTADARYLSPAEVIAGTNITVDTTTTPGSVIINGAAGGGGTAIYTAPLSAPPTADAGVWRIVA